MCAAIALSRAGVAVELVEIEENWQALGAGLSMNGATLRAFERLGNGVLKRIVAEGYCHDVRKLFDAAGNETFASPAERIFGPDVPNGGGILRPVLHEILRDAVRDTGVKVRLGDSIADFNEAAGGVHVRFVGGDQADYDLIVGADGYHSPLRHRLFPDAPASIFTGQGCWRAVVPRPAHITGACTFLGDQKVGVNPVSQSEMYLFLLQHVPDNPWMAPEDWRPLLIEQLQEFGGLIAEIRDNLDDNARINYRPLMAHVLPAPWHKGRALLIGDAAHATTPHAAYGAGLAVEDAVVLGELVGRDLPLDQVFEQFMSRRFEKCKRVIEGSIEMGRVELAHGDADEYRGAWDAVQSAVRMPI